MLGTAAAMAVLAAFVLRGAGPPASARPEPRRAPPPRASPPAPERILPSATQPARDLFRYGDAEPDQSHPTARREPDIEPPPALVPETPPPLRLVGFVRQSGSSRAVLSLYGEVVVLGVGESAGTLTVVTIDEDAGVRLRDSDGREQLLTPPPD